MSKTLFIVSAFLISFLLIAPKVLAQADDSSGFAPEPATTPAPTTQPVDTPAMDMPVDTGPSARSQILNNLRNDAINKYQTDIDNYSTTLATPTEASTYQLKGILVSARYHKLIELYVIYLQNIEQAILDYNATSGFKVEGSETQLNMAQQQITTISNLVDDYDQSVSSYSGSEQAAVQAKSKAIKTQLEATRLTLSKLVGMMQ